MRPLATIPATPPADLKFKRSVGAFAAIRDTWAHRELVATLTERELRVRYKQAALGVLWALAAPITLILVFTVLFKHVGDFSTGTAPYVLFSFVGLVAWNFFSAAMAAGGLSLYNNGPLLNKVYCPREVFPLSSVGVAAVDTLISLIALVVLFLYEGFLPKVTSYWAIPLILLEIAFTVATTLIVSAVVVYVRDIRHVLPIVLQAGLFATPVAYPMGVVPADWRQLYCAINPLAAVIDGLRQSVLYGAAPHWELTWPALVTTTLLLVISIRFFKRLEAGFADLI